MMIIHTIATALLLVGAGSPASTTGNPPQPGPQFNTAPEVYFYSSPGRSYLGIDIQDVTADRVGPLKLKEERGVEVTMVDQDAPAGKAGLKEHDVIMEFNGTTVESEEQLRRLLREMPPGRTVNLGISRDGNPMQISVQLGDRNKIFAEHRPKTVVIPPIPRLPNSFPFNAPGNSFQFNTYSASLGIQTENLSRQLGEYFGVRDGEGILVRSVEKGSPAEKAGLKAGDCIVRADNEKLSDRADLSRVLHNHREGGKVTLGIVRDKHEQNIVVELPQKSSSDSSWNYLDLDQLKSLWREGDSSWNYVDLDQMESVWKELEDTFENFEPEIDRARDMASTRIQSEVARATRRVNDLQPRIDRAIRQAESTARRMQKTLELREKELKNRLSDRI
jgi:membrane-associated protease RseP (regulator of RpoE activity)